EARRKAVEEVMTGRLGQRLVVTRAEVDRRLQGLKSKAKSTQKQKSKLAVSVGDIISLEKAVSAGADIIYLGGDQFRSKPPMGREQLARGIELCLKRDITPVVQLPRLVHEQQVNNLAGYIEYIDSAGGRAVQVPDIGALALALKHGNLAVYADYGLNVFNDYTLRALDKFGVRVSTLSPELNLAQIKSLMQTRSQACEFLVYGALPLMITEHCTVGSLLGGGNRKGCSRPCTTSKYGLKDRMSFTFPVETDQNCRMYIFNAKELNLLENLGDITAAGAHSLRLELKKDSAEYVAKVTKVFRRELDRAWGMPQYRPLDESMELLKELRPGGYTKGHYFRGVLQ
ncbi:MAG TPA: peptidase U32 family protein, partial [Verrucomicrobiae bacterium]|nr:peptidase U32 family protein [Verrucomicrobiae bacterium]